MEQDLSFQRTCGEGLLGAVELEVAAPGDEIRRPGLGRQIEMRVERGGGERIESGGRFPPCVLVRASEKGADPWQDPRQGPVAQAEGGIAIGRIGEDASARGPGPATGNSEPRLITPALPKEAARRHSGGIDDRDAAPAPLRVQRDREADDAGADDGDVGIGSATGHGNRPGENGPAALRLPPGAEDRAEDEADAMRAGRDRHRAEEDVGLQDRGFVAVDLGRPTRDDRDR